MSEDQEHIDAVVKYRDERDLAQFHDSKNHATATGGDVAELNELLLWKTNKESEQVARERVDRLLHASGWVVIGAMTQTSIGSLPHLPH